MTFPSVSRYADLVKGIIGGSFYRNEGIVLPYRSDNTEFRLEVANANTKYGIYVNEIYTGHVISDSQGNVEFERILPLGEVEIALENPSGLRVFVYLTVREYAIWLASYAEALEVIDANIIQTSSNVSIDTAEMTSLEAARGTHFDFYANIGQDVDVYRHQIKELTSSFRDYGGKFKGFNEAVAEITQIEPFGYSRRKWGPRWVLDQNFFPNHRALDRSHTVAKATNNITGLDIVKVEPDVMSNPAVAHALSWSGTALTWTPDGSAGPATSLREGVQFIPGPPSTKAAWVLGRDVSVTPYSIAASNYLYFDIDSKGLVEVPLTTGIPAPTPANIATDINTVLAADPRYGAGYAAAASVYNSKLLVESQVAGGTVKVMNSHLFVPAYFSIAPEVFGIKPGDIKFNPELRNKLPSSLNIPGITAVSVSGSFPKEGYANVSYQYNPTGPVYRIRWLAPGAAYGAYTNLTASGVYTVTDASGNILTISVDFDDLYTNSSLWNIILTTWSLRYSRVSEALKQTQGCWVDATVADLPAGAAIDNVTVVDDVTDGYTEYPDNWSAYFPSANYVNIFQPSEVITAKEDPYDPTPAFQVRFTDATSDNAVDFAIPVRIHPSVYDAPRGQNYPQTSYAGAYDYEGFRLEISFWVKNLLASTFTMRLDLTFDGFNSNVDLVGPVAITGDAGGLGYEDYTFVSTYYDIPEYTGIVGGSFFEDTAMSINVYGGWAAGAVSDLIIDAPSATVKYISSRYLGNDTVARNRHRSYFGELMWVWSPEALTLQEQKYLGLDYKAASPSSVMGGIKISSISSDTPNGAGTFEYEYTPATSLRRFRWQPYGTAYGPGLGWTTITSDATYTLTAPDSSTIDVDAIYNFLPILSGSATSTSTRTITISDSSIERGLPRKISPAHSALDIIDVTEYDSSGTPVNLIGCISETDFSTCGLINSEIASSDPFKFSYIYPEFPAQEGEILSLSLVGANYEATLNYICDEDQSAAILYEDGIPVPNNMWSFSANDTVQIPQAWFLSGDLSLASTFTIDYDLLYQVETPVLDLGATFDEYLWHADYFLWERYDKVQDSYENTVPVFFNLETGRAYLEGRSDMNKSTSTLFVQRSSEQQTISNRYWRFEDDQTISIDIGALVSGQYYLTHKEKRVYPESDLTVTFENRSSNTSAGVLLDTYTEIDKNEVVRTFRDASSAYYYRYHQLRLSISGIRDLSDFKIRSLTLKGLKIRGATPYVRGLTNIWGV